MTWLYTLEGIFVKKKSTRRTQREPFFFCVSGEVEMGILVKIFGRYVRLEENIRPYVQKFFPERYPSSRNIYRKFCAKTHLSLQNVQKIWLKNIPIFTCIIIQNFSWWLKYSKKWNASVRVIRMLFCSFSYLGQDITACALSSTTPRSQFLQLLFGLGLHFIGLIWIPSSLNL